jgi:hypothetical protein
MYVSKRLEYQLTPQLKGKQITEVAVSGLLALIILALVALWSAATAGYETTQIFSPNWNLTDNDHWYSKFIPGPKGPLCQPAFINTGSTFRTTNGVFLWEMGKGFNVSSIPVNQNNATQVNFNATTLGQYSDSTLDHCDVSGVSIDMDLMRATVSVQIYVTCVDPKWPALLHTTEVFSMDQSALQDDSLWFNQIIIPDPAMNVSIPDSMNGLASDLWSRMKSVYLRSGNLLPTIRGLRMTNANNCALVTGMDNKTICYDAPLKLANNTGGFFLYPNLTIAKAETDEVDWNVTTNNFVNAIFAAARYDFGANMTTNLFVNDTARTQLISRSDAAQLDNSTYLMNTLDGAATFLDSPVIPDAKIARIKASYLCSIMKMKQIPAFVIAVIGFALAIFGVVFAAAVAIIKKATGRDLGVSVPGPIAALSPITSVTSRRDDTGGDKGRHQRSTSSADYDSQNGTPAPSYHLNARGAMYQPLNDAAKSGTATPIPSGKLSSFSGIARTLTDMLPFGIGEMIPSKWLGAAAGAVGGAGLAAAAAGAAGVGSGNGEKGAQSDLEKAEAGHGAIGSAALLATVPDGWHATSAQAQAMFARPAQAAHIQQIYDPANADYMPFAYPETPPVAGQGQYEDPYNQQQGASQYAAEYQYQHHQAQHQQTHQPQASAAAASTSDSSYNPYVLGAGALAAGGAAFAGTQLFSNKQQTEQGGYNTAQTPARVTSPGPPNGSTTSAAPAYSPGASAETPTVPARVTSPGPPHGNTSTVPARVTSPGPPQGYTSSVPARVTSPGPPVGARSAVAQSTGSDSTATAVGAGVGAGALVGGAAYALHASSSSDTPASAPPIQAPQARYAGPSRPTILATGTTSVPVRVTSPGAPHGTTGGLPARVTSPGPPHGAVSGLPSRVTSPGPPVGARSKVAPTATTAATSAAPKVLSPQPSRTPSPTWLADQEAAAAAATSKLDATKASTTTNIAAAANASTDSVSASLRSPLSQIQRTLANAQSAATGAVSNASGAVTGAVSGAVNDANGAATGAANAFASKNPFSK